MTHDFFFSSFDSCPYWLNYLTNRHYFGIRGEDPNPVFSDFWANVVFLVGSGFGGGWSGGRGDSEQRQPPTSTPAYQHPQTLQPLPGLCPHYHVSIPVTSNLLKTRVPSLPSPLNPLAAFEPWVLRPHRSLLSIRLSWEKGGEPHCLLSLQT